jgi:hypothetical protein
LYPKRAPFPGAELALALAVLGLAGAARAAEYTIRPEMTVEQTLDDNVLSAENETGRSPSTEISSWGTNLSPAVGLTRKTGVSEASLQAGVTRRNTYSLSDLDGTDERVGISARRILSPRLAVGAQADYDFYASFNAIEASPGGTQALLFGERPELSVRNLTTDLTYTLDDRTELKAELGWTDWDYGRTEELTDLYDSEERSASLTLTRQLTPIDKAGGVLGFGLTEEESIDDSGLLPGVRTEDELATLLMFWERTWTPRWTTILQAGTRMLDSERETDLPFDIYQGPPFCPPNSFCVTDPPPFEASDDGGGFVGGGTLAHRYSDRGQVSLAYSRDTRTGTSSTTGSSAIDIDTLSTSVSHTLAPRLSLWLRGSYLRYETTSESGELRSGAETEIRTAEARLSWQMRRNLTAYASYLYYDFDQERPLSITNPRREYARRIVGFGIQYAFDHEL